jgi:hypothetical protein
MNRVEGASIAICRTRIAYHGLNETWHTRDKGDNMTLFVGGPYHGKDLPFDPPLLDLVHLPAEDQLEEFWARIHQDPLVTVNMDWPFVYELDRSTTPEFYRHIG